MLPQVQCCWATNYYKTGVHIEIPMKILFWTGQNEKLYYSNVAISFPVITYRWESTVPYFTSKCQNNGRCSYPIVGNNDEKYTNLRYQTGLAQPIPLKNMRSSVGSILPNWMETQSKCSKPPAPWYCCLNEIPYVPWLNDMFFFYDFLVIHMSSISQWQFTIPKLLAGQSSQSSQTPPRWMWINTSSRLQIFILNKEMNYPHQMPRTWSVFMLIPPKKNMLYHCCFLKTLSGCMDQHLLWQ